MYTGFNKDCSKKCFCLVYLLWIAKPIVLLCKLHGLTVSKGKRNTVAVHNYKHGIIKTLKRVYNNICTRGDCHMFSYMLSGFSSQEYTKKHCGVPHSLRPSSSSMGGGIGNVCTIYGELRDNTMPVTPCR